MLLKFTIGNMKTRFYKILYKNKDVVYVGVTTRAITERFKEHLISKSLNLENYSVVEFYCAEHPPITSLEVFYEEWRKVAELERRYIQEEQEKGAVLLNISKGGEWGTAIVNKLKKEEFRRRFGSYDNYEEYKRKVKRSIEWLRNWVLNRSINKTKVWINHWVEHRSSYKVKGWMSHWISNSSKSMSKKWLQYWVRHKAYNKTKGWLFMWVRSKLENKTKVWVKHWVSNRSKNKMLGWVQHWVEHRSERKSKIWVRSWISARSISGTKRSRINRN